jgi:hypothetical protein
MLAEAGDADGVAFVTAAVTPLQDTLAAVLAGVDVPSKDASDAIGVLKSVVFTIKSRPAFQAKAQAVKAEAQAALPVGIQAMNAAKVITNRRPGKCSFCATQVEAGAGFAVLKGSWSVVCKPCADTSPEDRQAAQAVERAARQVEASQAQGKRAEVVAFAIDLFDRTGEAGSKIPEVRVAIDSLTGNNDLDFFRVRLDPKKSSFPKVMRVIGGQADTVVNLTVAHAALEALVFVDDAKAAVTRYGQELGHCGVCGRHLTDETSRDIGIGPECRKHF